jgi:hypothetical protein
LIQEKVKIPFTRVHIGRFAFLFVSMISLFLLRPFLESYIGLKILMLIFVTFVMLSGVYAVSDYKRRFIIGMIIFLPAITVNWGQFYIDSLWIFILAKAFGLVFIAHVIVSILIYLFKKNQVTADMIMGAVCVYLLFGIMWSFGYGLIELILPGSFNYSGDPDTALFYYSYITLTTVGYGDVVPVLDAARSFAILEAVTGQIYLAVLVARLVGMYSSQSSGQVK